MKVEFREITDATREQVLAIHAGRAEGRYVSSVAGSLAEAEAHPEGKPWYRSIHVGDEPVGFVMLSWNLVPCPPGLRGPWFLWKLIVDEPLQGRGIGRAAVEEVVRLILGEGATELITSHGEGEGSPAGFYERLGFEPTGEYDEDGERIMRLDLTT